MNHEQNRPDGEGQTNTPAGWKGPHLRVKWQNIDAAWRPQWEGQKRSYYGSQSAGYAAYDYGSMMHYGLGDNADATNSAWQSVPGQRAGLSDGDVRQFQDMYQCGSAPRPAPAPSPGPAPAGCVDSTSNPWGQSCATWLAQGACATSNGIREHCKVSCQQCSPSGPAPAPAASSGCTDPQGQLSYGLTCVEWALRGDCAGSQTLQRDCPGSCAEASKVVSSLTCAAWQKRGDCPDLHGQTHGQICAEARLPIPREGCGTGQACLLQSCAQPCSASVPIFNSESHRLRSQQAERGHPLGAGYRSCL